MRYIYVISLVLILFLGAPLLIASENPLANITAPAPQPACPFPSGRPIFGRPLGVDYLRIIPYGYVKWEMFFDSRQVIGSRENQLLFFPAPPNIDIFGNDINSHGEWHMTSIESRFGIAVIGPDWGDIKTNAALEG
ncbi:hypothetical protein H0X06_07165, partial [Candidatus Dependentiae bacterium]|nr:hypothetical protein [Candidatus Dependentiae bacterium]